jgi:ATP-dependent helicase/DNAse subunit B
VKKPKKPKEGEPEVVEAPSESLLEKSKNYIVDYVTRIGNGDFEVRPNGEVSCRGCQHSMICRITECRASDDEDAE